MHGGADHGERARFRGPRAPARPGCLTPVSSPCVPSVRARSLLGLAVCALLGACEPQCVDTDQDGFGAACAMGPDCDDTNVLRNVDCDAVPAPDCDADPAATGCPCLAASSTPCTSHPEVIPGAGICRSGRASCVGGHWGVCRGEVPPDVEVCDAIDEDCDGRVDEGTRSPCGGCDSECRGGVWGEADAPFDGTSPLALTDLGELTLARESYAAATVWAANSADGTLSRIDAATATEVARYTTELGSSFGNEPSRVAVDWQNDVWVLDRAFDGQGTATKIASERARCVDRDHDGTIHTSTGPGDVVPDDECILFTVPVGALGEVPRAIAIDGGGLDGAGAGNAWVGLFGGEAILELDGTTGAELRRIDTPHFAPYAAAIDPWGYVWMSSREGYLVRVDPARPSAEPTSIEVPLPYWLIYSFAIDSVGRIGMTGFSCDDVAVYDPRNGAIAHVSTAPSTRGAVFDPDGHLWVAHTGGLVSMLDVAPLRVRRTIDLRVGDASPIDTVGLGSDTIGHVWAVSEHGGTDDLGVATRVDLEGGAISAQVTIGAAPHTQGDLTGVMRGGAFLPEGSESHVFRGCSMGDASWVALHYEAHEGTTGTILFEARHAADEASLAAAAFVALGTVPGSASPLALSFPAGGVVEVRVTLRAAARLGAPRLGRVGLEWSCPGPD